MSYTYYAFVSYSRKDKAAARYLQNQLESYRYPAMLVDEEHKPKNPKYLRKIFRDTSDLDVNQSSFTDAIDRHIAESRYLIVLCSPNSQKSVWVEREIVRFLETHDHDPQLIFPVILEGDIPDCLPEKLRTPDFLNRNLPTMIPDGATSRKDGWEHGFLQLVGCLLNVSTAKIADRFQKAKQAVLRRIIFGTVAVLAVTIGLTAWALLAEQRAKQEEQRARAAERKAVAAEKAARREAEIAKATVKFLKEAFDAADPNKGGDKDMTLLEFAKHASARLSKLTVPEVKLQVAGIILSLLGNMGDPQTALIRMRPLLPEAERMFPANSPELAVFDVNLARLFFNNAWYDNAVHHFRRALNFYRAKHHVKEEADIHERLSWILYRKNKYEESEREAEQALRLYHNIGEETGISHVYILKGSISNSNGEYDKAIEYHLQALTIYRKKLGSNHPNTAVILNNIGAVYSSKGEHDKAIEYYQQALSIRRNKLGGNHPGTAMSLYAIGSIYHKKGEHDKAIEYYQQALSTYRKKLGEAHPNTAMILGNIIKIYQTEGKYDKAIECLLQSLSIKRKNFGAGHTSSASTMLLIGNTYRAQGKYDKAIEYYRQALTIYRKKHGGDHQYAATCLNNIGLAYGSKGEHDKAIEYYRQALTIYRKKLGDDHQYVATCLNNIGLAYGRKGEYDKAIECYQKSLEITRRKLGDDHPSTANTLSNIGDVRQSKGEYDKAIDYYQKSWEIKRKKLGGDHWSSAWTETRLGYSLVMTGDASGGMKLLDHALAVQRKKLGDDHPETARSYHFSGLAHLELAKRDKSRDTLATARKYLQKALSIREKQLGPNHPETREAVRALEGLR